MSHRDSNEDRRIAREEIKHGDLIKTEHEGQLGLTRENQYYVEAVLPTGIYVMSHGLIGYDNVVEVIPYPELSESKKPVKFNPYKRQRETERQKVDG